MRIRVALLEHVLLGHSWILPWDVTSPRDTLPDFARTTDQERMPRDQAGACTHPWWAVSFSVICALYFLCARLDRFGYVLMTNTQLLEVDISGWLFDFVSCVYKFTTCYLPNPVRDVPANRWTSFIPKRVVDPLLREYRFEISHRKEILQSAAATGGKSLLVNREGMKIFGGYHVNEYKATGQLTRGNQSDVAPFRHHRSSDVNTALVLRLAFTDKKSSEPP